MNSKVSKQQVKKPRNITKVKLETPIVKQKDRVTPGSVSLLPHIYRGPKRPGSGATKVYDLAVQNITPSTTASLLAIFAPAQGVALNQRTGDVIYYQQMEMIYTCNAANADIYSSLRVMLFQWHPNSNLIAPTAADILQTVTEGIYAVVDYGYSNQFIIFYDQLHAFAGTATNPSASSNQAVHKVFGANSVTRKVLFAPGTNAGSNILFLLTVSDSAVAPTPNLNFKFRVTYEEEN